MNELIDEYNKSVKLANKLLNEEYSEQEYKILLAFYNKFTSFPEKHQTQKSAEILASIDNNLKKHFATFFSPASQTADQLYDEGKFDEAISIRNELLKYNYIKTYKKFYADSLYNLALAHQEKGKSLFNQRSYKQAQAELSQAKTHFAEAHTNYKAFASKTAVDRCVAEIENLEITINTTVSSSSANTEPTSSTETGYSEEIILAQIAPTKAGTKRKPVDKPDDAPLAKTSKPSVDASPSSTQATQKKATSNNQTSTTTTTQPSISAILNPPENTTSLLEERIRKLEEENIKLQNLNGGYFQTLKEFEDKNKSLQQQCEQTTEKIKSLEEELEEFKKYHANLRSPEGQKKLIHMQSVIRQYHEQRKCWAYYAEAEISSATKNINEAKGDEGLKRKKLTFFLKKIETAEETQDWVDARLEAKKIINETTLTAEKKTRNPF